MITFFRILENKPFLLYGPSDYRDEEFFYKTINQYASVPTYLESVENKLEDLNKKVINLPSLPDNSNKSKNNNIEDLSKELSSIKFYLGDIKRGTEEIKNKAVRYGTDTIYKTKSGVNSMTQYSSSSKKVPSSNDDVTPTVYYYTPIEILTSDSSEWKKIESTYLSAFNQEDNYGGYMEVLINQLPSGDIIKVYSPEANKTWNVIREYDPFQIGFYRGKPRSAYQSIPPVKCFDLSLNSTN